MSPAQKISRRASVGISHALELYLTEHKEAVEIIGWDRLKRLAFAEGIAAIVDAYNAQGGMNGCDVPIRFDAVPGPRRLREYEKQIEAVEKSLSELG